jgi:hypothetical protein
MTQPQWDPTQDSWTTTVTCPAFGTLEVLIKTLGPSDPPSDRQLAALAVIEGLPKTVRKPIRKSLRRYAKENLDAEEFDDLEPEDFQLEVSACLIPRLKTAEAVYFFLYGDSEIDFEHGLACLCKGGTVFGVCDTDAMYETYPCDATHRFETMLGLQAVKLDDAP